MIKGQLSTGFPSNKHPFSIEKAQRGSTSWNNLRTSSTCAYISQWKAHKSTCSTLPTGRIQWEKKRPKTSFLRCYTPNMKELSANQISLLARQKQFLHNLTFETLSLTALWLNHCDLLWAKLWSRFIWPSYFYVCWVHCLESKTGVSTSSFTMISSGLTITEHLFNTK